MSISTLWVVVEPSKEGLTTTSVELFSYANTLSASVAAITWGDNTVLVAKEAGEFGATILYDVGNLHGDLPGGPVSSAIDSLISLSGAPDAILLPASYDGRDIAGRLSARLDRPVLTNVTGLEEEGGLVTEHPVFGGTQMVKARFTGDGPGIIVVRPKSFAAQRNFGPSAQVISAPPSSIGSVGNAKIMMSHVEERTGPQLEDAEVVVSGGRGLGDASNYSLVIEVAKLLKGAPGASRAIVDAGWVPYSHQVGQTGKTVKPKVYIACGISGATQHMVGMKGSTYIIAINKDADAPIFQISDFGIIGDVNDVLPALIQILRARG